MENNYEKAIADYKQKIDKEKDNVYTWYDLGNVYFGAKNYTAAITAYQKVLDLSADFYLAHHQIGNTFFVLGVYDKAIAAYEKTLAIQPDYTLAWYNLGANYLMIDKYEEAIAAYENVVKYEPTKTMAWLNLGNAYFMVGDSQQAILAYEKTVALTTTQPLAIWQNYGLAHAELGNYEKAITLLKKALTGDPSDKHWIATEEDCYVLGNMALAALHLQDETATTFYYNLILSQQADEEVLTDLISDLETALLQHPEWEHGQHFLQQLLAAVN